MRFLLCLLASTALLHAGEKLEPEKVRALASDYLQKKTLGGIPTGLSSSEALAAQHIFVQAISKELGRKAGYKVGLVTKANQERMGASGPVRGVLLKKMLLPNNARLPVNFAARPAVEADLVVTIKDSGINKATTLEEVAAHVAEIVAFIELPDSQFAPEQKLDGGVLEVANVGARAGVLGDRVKFKATPEFIQAFGKMRIIFTDKSGRELVNKPADIILGHPLNALLFLVQDLKKSGEKLKAGDVISLGSPVASIPPQAGETYSLRYEGLPGGPLKASVQFK